MSTFGVISLLGEFNDELYNAFLHEFLELEHEHDKLIIYLNSPGGNVRTALSIYDLIKSSKANVVGVNMGTCYSAANIVLQACIKRYALPHASFMIHAGSSELPETPYTEFPAAVRLDKHEMQLADSLTMARATNVPALKRLYKRGEYFSSAKAKELGLIDDILLVRI
jgi:ATP-dependent Clp protease, protease subunit